MAGGDVHWSACRDMAAGTCSQTLLRQATVACQQAGSALVMSAARVGLVLCVIIVGARADEFHQVLVSLSLLVLDDLTVAPGMLCS